MNLAQTILSSLSGGLFIFFTSTNVQTTNVCFWRKLIIFVFAITSICLLAPFIGQFATPFVLAGTCFLLSYKITYKMQNIISFLFGYLSMVCLDYIFSNAAYVFFHLSIIEIQKHHLLPYSIIYLLLVFMFTKYLGYLLHKKLKIQTLVIQKYLFLTILINLAICILIFVLGIIYGYKTGFSWQIVSINGILFIFYFTVSSITYYTAYHITIKNQKLELKNTEYEHMKLYIQEVENISKDLRSFRHDYLNILYSLKNFIDKEDMSGLSQYFYNDILPTSHNATHNEQNIERLTNLHIDALKGLIAARLIAGSAEGIHIDVEVAEPIDRVDMHTIDSVRIIGIFFDNAVEAARLSKEKELKFVMIKNSNNITFIICNSTPPPPVPIDELCKQGFTTKTSHSGIGLTNVYNILNTYENIDWKMYYEAPYFYTELAIYTI